MTFQIHAICSADQWNQACSLLQQVYVNEGYTSISNAQEFMVQERFENQSETIVATANNGKILGVVLYLFQDSLLRQVSQANEREFRMLGVAISPAEWGWDKPWFKPALIEHDRKRRPPWFFGLSQECSRPIGCMNGLASNVFLVVTHGTTEDSIDWFMPWT